MGPKKIFLLILLSNCLLINKINARYHLKVDIKSFPVLSQLRKDNNLVLDAWNHSNEGVSFDSIIVNICNAIKEQFYLSNDATQLKKMLLEVQSLINHIQYCLLTKEKKIIDAELDQLKSILCDTLNCSKLIDPSKYPNLSKLKFGNKLVLKKWNNHMPQIDKDLDTLFIIYAIEANYLFNEKLTELNNLLIETDRLLIIIKPHLSDVIWGFIEPRVKSLKEKIK